MIWDLKSIQKEHYEVYNDMRSKISSYKDQFHSQEYQFAFVEKEGNWFGATPVNLVLRHSKKGNEQQFVLFYEKSVFVIDKNFDCIPCNEPNEKIRLENVRLIRIVNKQIINVLYLASKQKIQQINFKFKDYKIAKQWQKLINQKTKRAKQLVRQQSSASQNLKKAQEKIKELVEQLARQRRQKNEALDLLSEITEECNRYKIQCLNQKQKILELENDIELSRVMGSDESSKRQLLKCKDSCSILEHELSQLKSKLSQQQLRIIEIQQKQHKIRTRLQEETFQNKKQIHSLERQINEFQAKKNVNDKFVKELINKILARNRKLIEMNDKLSDRESLSKSVLVDNEQDYRRLSGYIDNGRFTRPQSFV